MVLPRVLTALIAAPLFLWVIFLGSWPFVLFVLFLTLLALLEFHRMAAAGGYADQGLWGVAGGTLVSLSLIFPGIRPALPFAAQAPALMIMIVVAALVLREFARADKGLSMLRVATSLLGVFFVAWPLGHLILLRDLRGYDPIAFMIGRNATFFLVFLIWTQDTVAWAAGRAFGRHPLAPRISPKKTWEGGVAGTLAAAVVALLLRELWFPSVFGRVEVVGLAVFLCVLAQLSDLAESLMKRCFDVKDSSDLLPGHGGILDRFDSFIFSAPFFYFYLIGTGRV